jgi:IS5 family transposase
VQKEEHPTEVFLAKMEQVVPWSRLMEVIEPYYPKSEPMWNTRFT